MGPGQSFDRLPLVAQDNELIGIRMTYRAGLDAQRQSALQALADDLQELGLD